MKTFMPIGSVKTHHMPEEYYTRWEKLRAAEKRTYAKARAMATNARAWQTWERAAARLKEHENVHNTH